MKRDLTIDVAKGLGILLVVFAHTYRGGLGGAIYLFHMPLFFILTGCALSYSQSHAIKWKRLWQGIVIPYLAFSLLSFAYWALIESRFRPVHDASLFPSLDGVLGYKLQQFLNIFTAFDKADSFIYNVVLWFLPCLAMCRILEGLASKGKSPFAVSIIFAAMGYALIYMLDIQLPWCVELSLVVIPLIVLARKYYHCLKMAEGNMLLTQISIWGGYITIFLIWQFTDARVNMLGHQLGGLWFYATAVAGSAATISLSHVIARTKLSAAISHLGKNSLLIMCMHEPVKRIVIKVASVVTGAETEVLRENLGMSLAMVTVTVVILLPIIYAINRWVPIVAGGGMVNNKE